jgi:hypothetical protein
VHLRYLPEGARLVCALREYGVWCRFEPRSICACKQAEYGEDGKISFSRYAYTCDCRIFAFSLSGKIIGIAIRTNRTIDLSFPSIIWKLLLKMKVTADDFVEIDQFTYNFIQSVAGVVLLQLFSLLLLFMLFFPLFSGAQSPQLILF